MPGIVETSTVTAVGNRRYFRDPFAGASCDEVLVECYSVDGNHRKFWCPTALAPSVGECVDITVSWGYSTAARSGDRKLLDDMPRSD